MSSRAARAFVEEDPGYVLEQPEPAFNEGVVREPVTYWRGGRVELPDATKQIPVFKPLLEDEELAAAREALELGWLGMGASSAVSRRSSSGSALGARRTGLTSG